MRMEEPLPNGDEQGERKHGECDECDSDDAAAHEASAARFGVDDASRHLSGYLKGAVERMVHRDRPRTL